MKRFYWLFLLFPFYSLAQFQIKGIVKDNTSKNPLPFATIITNNLQNTVSDVDGKFLIESKEVITSFSVSYLGFSKIVIPVDSKRIFYTVLLIPSTADLKEVVISNENPAIAIIQKVIQNKNNNNPQKKLKSFEFKSYNKLIITANPDSIDGRIDSLFVKKSMGQKLVKVDSSDYQFKKVISKQHLFQTEKVSQFQFSEKDGLKETILGSKMAGFKQPIYEILSFNLQSFSVYDNRYELFETKYNSPIADNTFSNYNFKLLDSITIQDRKTYMVYFKNKKKKRTTGLEGVLYIDQKNYAITKAIMRIKGVLDISGTHEFNYLPEENIWFPVYKNFKIVKGNKAEDIRLLGETVIFDDNDNSKNKSRKKVASDFTYLQSETNSFDFSFNLPIAIKNPFIYMEIKEDAENKKETFWNTYRKDSLDFRSQRTYTVLDSIVEKEKIEKLLRSSRKILNGYFPLGPFDIDLRYLLSYNNYEGFRLGIGGKTSENFSRKFKIEGYSAYGIKDDALKYSLGFAARIGKNSNSWIGASYTDDVKEIGSTSFIIDRRVFKFYDPRPINVSTFYAYQNWRIYYETKILPKTESVLQLTHSIVEPKFDYVYNLNGVLYDNYTITSALFSLQWNPFSDYLQTPNGRFEVEKRFPKFTFQFTQSIPNWLQNDFVFGKIDFRTEYEKKYLNGQKTAFLVEAGYAYGAIPLTHLYNTSPNNLNKDKIIQRITFSGKNSFETMFFNEFFSREYVIFQLKHGFKRIELFKKVKPLFVFVSRMAWGNLEKREQHVGLNYKTLEKGYLESGIELNQIYSGFGLAGFYRYGPNQLNKFEDNLAIKISFVLDLGL